MQNKEFRYLNLIKKTKNAIYSNLSEDSMKLSPKR